DVAQTVHVRPATKLETVAPGAHDAHLIAVLIAKEGDRAHLLRVGLRGLNRLDGLIGDDVGIDQREDLPELFATHSGAVSEVEAQPVWSDVGTLLTHVV